MVQTEYIDDARRLRKQSQQLRHKCRNTRGVSMLWKEITEELVTTIRTNRTQRVKNDIKENGTYSTNDPAVSILVARPGGVIFESEQGSKAHD
jgi:hypothetical protein